MPWTTRVFEFLRRRVLKLFGWAVPCEYISHQTSGLDLGYLLIEDISGADSQMLSDTWRDQWTNKVKRDNLFRDLARIMLAVGRVPQQRIGSFRIDHHGYITLSNRPMSCHLTLQESEKINIGIERSRTYNNSLAYVHDLISTHDRCLRQQPNSVESESDCHMQMVTFTAMRAILPHYFSPASSEGPFRFQLTDVHTSNLFVDKNWNITHVIDLEFAACVPQELEKAPYWISNQDYDDIRDATEKYDRIHEEFVEISDKTSKASHPTNSLHEPTQLKQDGDWQDRSIAPR
jgi:Phosphotransferase enzyme family